MKILVADDEESLRDLLVAQLTRQGHEVVVAKDGEEALRLYTDGVGPFDCVVTDYQMPRKNGVVLITDIRKINPAQRVVLVSGDPPQIPDFVRKDTGDFPVLRKPYRFADLALLL